MPGDRCHRTDVITARFSFIMWNASKIPALRTALISPIPALAADFAASFLLSFLPSLDPNRQVPQRLATFALALTFYACLLAWQAWRHRSPLSKQQTRQPVQEEPETNDEEPLSVLPPVFASALMLVSLGLFWLGPVMMAVNIRLHLHGTPGIATTICWLCFTVTILPSLGLLYPFVPIVTDTPAAILLSRRGKQESLALQSIEFNSSPRRPLPPLPLRFLTISGQQKPLWSGLVLESALQRLSLRKSENW